MIKDNVGEPFKDLPATVTPPFRLRSVAVRAIALQRALRDLIFRGISVIWLPLVLPLLCILIPLGRLSTHLQRLRGLKPRILYGTFALPDTAYRALADRQYGYDSHLLIWTPSYYNRAWEVPWHIRRLHRFYRVISLPRYLGFLWSLVRFDVFQYYFDNQQLHDTVLQEIELLLLKLAGKKLVLYYYGADVMVPGIRSYAGLDFYTLVVCDYPAMVGSAWRNKVRRAITRGSRYADCIISTVPFVDVMPVIHIKRHVAAINTQEWAPAAWQPRSKVRVVHAANHRTNKGTNAIIRVCRELEADGYPIEFMLVERMPREAAMRMYADADIIIEQLLSGNIGIFGIECMAMGKPVVAYLREDILDHHPWMEECPVINANLATLRERLIELLEDPDRRRRLGLQGRAYVEKYHSLEAIGAFDDQIYRCLWWGEGQFAALPSEGSLA